MVAPEPIDLNDKLALYDEEANEVSNIFHCLYMTRYHATWAIIKILFLLCRWIVKAYMPSMVS